MTKQQAKNKSAQLTMALELLLSNLSKTSIVKCLMTGPIDFEFRIKGYDLQNVDALSLIKEVEKILPNVRVTQALVAFHSTSIWLIAKELGRKGTYSFTFEYVRA